MAKKRADGRYEKTVTIDGKVVHFYGKTLKEVNAKIMACYPHHCENPLIP